MKIDFDCECGAEISGFTRGSDAEAHFPVVCDECGTEYAVSITKIRDEAR